MQKLWSKKEKKTKSSTDLFSTQDFLILSELFILKSDIFMYNSLERGRLCFPQEKSKGVC